jgi:hypothetical protein
LIALHEWQLKATHDNHGKELFSIVNVNFVHNKESVIWPAACKTMDKKSWEKNEDVEISEQCPMRNGKRQRVGRTPKKRKVQTSEAETVKQPPKKQKGMRITQRRKQSKCSEQERGPVGGATASSRSVRQST